MSAAAVTRNDRTPAKLFSKSGWPDGEALMRDEVFELAARMLDVSNERQFEHLLGATITHAAMRTGNRLTPAVGEALGTLLKAVARKSLMDPQPGATLGLDLEGLDTLEAEFEANLQFVRLAAEAARQAAEEFLMVPPDQAARAALAAASGVYAPPLTAMGETAWESEFEAGNEVFEYDPEMEYFLGGLIHSVGRAAKSVKNFAGDAARAVNKAANAVGRIPVLGDIVRGGLGAARLGLGSTAILIDAGSRLARGEKLGNALKGALVGQVDGARDALKLAEMVAPFVPGVGAGVGAALGAANALAAGKPITEALISAARSAMPGGAVAQAAFDVASNLARGKNIGDSLLAAARDKLPGGPAARAAFDAAVALGKGKKLQEVAFAAAGGVIPPSPYATDALSFVKGIANGQNVQSAALSVLGKRTLGKVQGYAAMARR